MVALFLATQLDLPRAWYGPATATFEVQFPGNPYDPDENDVHVLFTGDKGQKEDRIAYFDRELGAWKAVLVAREPGTYQAKLSRNQVSLELAPDEGSIQVVTALPQGFLRVNPQFPTKFRWDDGTPYVPVGYNLGWHSLNFPALPDQIDKMGAAGVNWTRVWACPWDGKNPWFPDGGQEKSDLPIKDQFWSPALEQWDGIVTAAERAQVPFQMVLFHHGLFSTTTNPNWPQNPWNSANGGFLKSPADFFTDPEAKRRTKMWLRTAVARYGSSPLIFAWELFNEVQWVDTVHEGRWDDVEAWHREMAAYLRSIDPYHHLVTSSSELRPGLNASLDFLQPHLYSNELAKKIEEAAMSKDKPSFFGEFGLDGTPILTRAALRDGIYTALLRGNSGAAMAWGWEDVDQKDLYGEFKLARKVLSESQFGNHPNARPFSLAVTPTVTTKLGIGENGWAVGRIRKAVTSGKESPVSIQGLCIVDGTYQLTVFDLDSGKEETSKIHVKDFSFSCNLPGADSILLVKREP